MMLKFTMAKIRQKKEKKGLAKANIKEGKMISIKQQSQQEDEKNIYTKYLKTNNKLLEKKIEVMQKQILLLCIINSKLDALKQVEDQNHL